MYVPVRQVAKEWHVSVAFILQEIKEGNLTAVDLAGYKIHRSDMKTYIDSHTVQPVSK
jgi:hypothetical protein